MKIRTFGLAVFGLLAFGLTASAFAASGYATAPRYQTPEQQNLGMQIYNQTAPGQQAPAPYSEAEQQNLGMQIYNQQQPQLTPEQYDLATRLYDKSARDVAEVRQELAAKLGLLDQELAQAVPDKRTIERLSREIGELRGKILSAGAELRARLAGNGLPPDCLGPCYSGDGYRHHNGWRGMMGGCWGYGGQRGNWGYNGGHHNGWRGMMGNW